MKEKRASKKNVFRRITVCLFLASLPVLFTSCITAALLIDAMNETTEEQMSRLCKMPEIEEFLITYDQDQGDDLSNVLYNEYEFYLKDDRFLKVSNLTESMHRNGFYGYFDPVVFAIDSYSVEVQRSDRPGKYLTFSDLSFLIGKEIVDLQDVIDNYSLILSQLENEPFFENDKGRFEIMLSPLDKTILAVRENEFFADLQTMPHIASIKKEKLKVTNQQYYKYEVKMDDGVQFDMTLSTVYRDGDDYTCDFFITSYNKKKIKWDYVPDKNNKYSERYRPYAGWYHFANDTGIKVKSYRDLFYNYEAFKKSVEAFIIDNAE